MNVFEPFDRVDEKPLDILTPDGGYSRILRTIACIGDSLSSGEFETVDAEHVTHYHDIFEQSWGQYLARMNGAKVYNFSKGGMSADVYCKTFAAANGYWSRAYASQAYILALGVNDLLNMGQPVGMVEDIDLNDWQKNKPTFAGYYGQIIQRYKEIQPEAKFFLMTMPRSTDNEERVRLKQQHAELLYQMAELFPNTYVLDFHRYAPVYDERFQSLFYLRGHLNPCGYLLTAQMVASYLDYIIRHNLEEFKHIGLT